MVERIVNLPEIVNPSGDGAYTYYMHGCNSATAVITFDNANATIRHEPGELPEEGLLIAGEWFEQEAPDDLCPYVIQVDEDGTHKALEPKEGWRYTVDGGGSLMSQHLIYVISVDDPGYFECFSREGFSLFDHLALLAEMVGATDYVPMGPLQPSEGKFIWAFNRLMIQNIRTATERDKAIEEVAERDGRLLEVAAWIQSLLHPGQTGPLGSLIKSKIPEAACLAKQVAGYLIRASMALGVSTVRVGISQISRAALHLDDGDLPATCGLLGHYRPDLAGTAPDSD